DPDRAVRRPLGGELLVRALGRDRRPEAESLHAARRRRAESAAAPGVVGAVAVVVPTLRRAGGESRGGGGARRHGQPWPAARAWRAVGGLEPRVGRNAALRRAARRDHFRRARARPREGSGLAR